METELLAMGDDITRHPEHRLRRDAVGEAAHRLAHARTTSRWNRASAKMPTAFVARYKNSNGAPNLGVIVEYDALRGTKGDFHGDQH